VRRPAGDQCRAGRRRGRAARVFLDWSWLTLVNWCRDPIVCFGDGTIRAAAGGRGPTAIFFSSDGEVVNSTPSSLCRSPVSSRRGGDRSYSHIFSPMTSSAVTPPPSSSHRSPVSPPAGGEVLAPHLFSAVMGCVNTTPIVLSPESRSSSAGGLGSGQTEAKRSPFTALDVCLEKSWNFPEERLSVIRETEPERFSSEEWLAGIPFSCGATDVCNNRERAI
jgi:hypothetical protein